jgi:hypothetical protein
MFWDMWDFFLALGAFTESDIYSVKKKQLFSFWFFETAGGFR